MSIEDGLRRANENLEAANRSLCARLDQAMKSADFWRELWERLLDDVCELRRKAQRRKPGRRFVRLLELDILVTRQDPKGVPRPTGGEGEVAG